MIKCKICGEPMQVEEHVAQRNGDYILYECPKCGTTCYKESVEKTVWKDEYGEIIKGEQTC